MVGRLEAEATAEAEEHQPAKAEAVGVKCGLPMFQLAQTGQAHSRRMAWTSRRHPCRTISCLKTQLTMIPCGRLTQQHLTVDLAVCHQLTPAQAEGSQ